MVNLTCHQRQSVRSFSAQFNHRSQMSIYFTTVTITDGGFTKGEPYTVISNFMLAVSWSEGSVWLSTSHTYRYNAWTWTWPVNTHYSNHILGQYSIVYGKLFCQVCHHMGSVFYIGSENDDPMKCLLVGLLLCVYHMHVCTCIHYSIHTCIYVYM